MDDKRFDEIMREYVDSAKRPKSVALKKLNTEDFEKSGKQKPAFRVKTATVSVLCMLLIFLSVALPMRAKSGQTRYIQYYGMPFGHLIVDGIDGIKAVFGENALYVTAKGMTNDYYLITETRGNDFFGAEVGVNATRYWDRLSFKMLEKDYNDPLKQMIVGSVRHFEGTLKWRNYDVSYLSTRIDEEDEYRFINYFYLQDSNYEYYLSVSTYEEISAEELLNTIYQ